MKNILLLLALLSLLPSSSFAAGLDIVLPKNTDTDLIEAVVILDTGGISVNSFDITLTYDSAALEFSGYQREDSLVKLWLKAPSAENGRVEMSGIIPGGISGIYDPKVGGMIPKIPVVTLLFRPLKSGETEIRFTDSLVLENDGEGTKLALEISNKIFKIDKTTLDAPEQKNTTPPGNLNLTFIEPSVFSRTPGMLVFQAEDEETGISKYEMKIARGPWREVQSPAPVKQGIFDRTVYIRAYDFDGNFKESSIRVEGAVPAGLFITIVLLAIAILAFKLLKYKE